MKGNWIKYVFIIFIILVMIAVIHKVNEKENQKEKCADFGCSGSFVIFGQLLGSAGLVEP